MDYTEKGYRRTIISFDLLRTLLRERDITDLQLARKIGEKVGVVRNIQLHPDITTIEVIRKICEELQCEPGDIMRRQECYVIPAREDNADAKKDPSSK